MTEGLVSVIMPTYNSSCFLADSIESILNQTYKKIELLITDDCSSDKNTINLLRKYEKEDDRVKIVFLHENMGPGYARNNSIERAEGQYMAFCDSDDRWREDKLECQIEFMKRNNISLCCSSYIICDGDNKEKGINVAPKVISFSMMKRDNKVGCLTAVYDIKLLGKKYFMPTIRKRQDWALFLSIIKDCKKAYGIQEPLAYYRLRGNSVSSNKFSLIKYNLMVYRQILGFNGVKSALYFTILFLPTYYRKTCKRYFDSINYLRKRYQTKIAH